LSSLIAIAASNETHDPLAPPRYEFP
jgi:hypothetical protein